MDIVRIAKDRRMALPGGPVEPPGDADVGELPLVQVAATSVRQINLSVTRTRTRMPAVACTSSSTPSSR